MNSEWELIQEIRRLRASGSRGAELSAAEEELVDGLRSKISETARQVRKKFPYLRGLDPPLHGDLENRLKNWVLHDALNRYDPIQHPGISFEKFVLSGWNSKSGGCIQNYLKDCRQQAQPEMESLDRPIDPTADADATLGSTREAEGEPLEEVERWHDAQVIADGVGIPLEELDATIGPLLLPRCPTRESGQGKCACPGCTSDEYSRRRAMLILLHCEVLFRHCSNELERWKWWSDLVRAPSGARRHGA